MTDNKPRPYRVLVGATGSVASIKVPQLVSGLVSKGYQVRLMCTDRALAFFSKSDALLNNVEVFTDTDEWNCWKKRGDPVLHIDLRNWCDLLLIAPLDANTLAKVAHGLADNLLTCVVRAWRIGGPGQKPVLFAPAMNTAMFEHPFTGEQMAVLEQRLHFRNLGTVSKTLMCGEEGNGAMVEVDTLLHQVELCLTSDD